jgi:DNA topoisomerase-1
MKLLIVESPAKSKTINGYLGKDYRVLASFGHIMELPSKIGSVDPENNFEMKYQFTPKSAKAVAEIASAAQKADEIYLATDPDREGEAISASIVEALKRKKISLKGKKIFRVAFNQITKNAILDAIKNPRDLDINLVEAQKARLALDYLVGFYISPVLWRKLPGSKSAGRVQSVALKILCERENEIEAFKKEEFWTIEADFFTKEGKLIKAVLEFFAGKKLEKMDISNETQATAMVDELKTLEYKLAKITSKEIKRKPYAPYMTSTLQQDASSKLGYSPKRTMLLAQGLYEGVEIKGETKGLITYMRTDSISISKEGNAEIRKFIEDEYGKKYLSETTNIYITKAKNSQEAHEAIRPVDPNITPKIASAFLSSESAKLYELIWKRAVASQGSDAIFESTKLEIASDSKNSFKANGSIMMFDGFQKIYDYGESEDSLLPKVLQNEKLVIEKVSPEQHFTQPPPRFGEATLVKRLEELGIGRPSTYASTIAVLQDREYAKLIEKRLVPQERGRVVTAFLESFFPKYVEYNFTAKLEEDLDLISSGEEIKNDFLSRFWKVFIVAVDEAGNKTPLEVSKSIESLFFKASESGAEPSKECPECKQGVLIVRAGRFGPFKACSNYPKCKYIAKEDETGEHIVHEEARVLGKNANGVEIFLKKGPYGYYVEVSEKGSKKPKRSSVPKDIDPLSLTLENALKMLSFPRNLGSHPVDGGDVIASIGPYGPYVSHNKKFFRLTEGHEASSITLEEALEVIANSPAKKDRYSKAGSEAPESKKNKSGDDSAKRKPSKEKAIAKSKK